MTRSGDTTQEIPPSQPAMPSIHRLNEIARAAFTELCGLCPEVRPCLFSLYWDESHALLWLGQSAEPEQDALLATEAPVVDRLRRFPGHRSSRQSCPPGGVEASCAIRAGDCILAATGYLSQDICEILTTVVALRCGLIGGTEASVIMSLGNVAYRTMPMELWGA